MGDSKSSRSSSQTGVVILQLFIGLVIAFAIFHFFLRPKIDRAFERYGKDTKIVMMGGKQAAESWLEEVRSGNLAKAYDSTTPRFRGLFSLSQFQELLAGHPGLKNKPKLGQWSTQGGSNTVSIGLGGVQAESTPTVFTLKGEIRPSGGPPERFELVILKDTGSDRLLVDRIDFESVPPAKP